MEVDRLAMDAVAVPDKDTFGLLLAFVWSTTAADLAPAVLGAKLTVIEQVAAGGTLAVQPLPSTNEPASGPVSAADPMVRGADPVFVTTMVWLADPVVALCAPKVKVVTDALAAGAIAVPDSTSDGLVAASVWRRTVDTLAPAVRGANVTVTRHVLPGATGEAQVFCTENEVGSVPASPMLVTVNGAVPVLDRVIV